LVIKVIFSKVIVSKVIVSKVIVSKEIVSKVIHHKQVVGLSFQNIYVIKFKTRFIQVDKKKS